MEGDSEMVHKLLTKLLQGSPVEKMSPSWHLLSLLETLSHILTNQLSLVPSRVKRNSNKVVDKLANEGVECNNVELICSPT